MKNLAKYLISIGSGGSATLNVNTNTFSNIDIRKPKEIILKKFHSQVFQILKKIPNPNIY